MARPRLWGLCGRLTWEWVGLGPLPFFLRNRNPKKDIKKRCNGARVPRAFVSTTLSACLLSPGLPPPWAVGPPQNFLPPRRCSTYSGEWNFGFPRLGLAPSAHPWSSPPPSTLRTDCLLLPTAHGLILPRRAASSIFASLDLPSLGGPNQSRKSRASYGEEGNVSNRRHDVARAARGRQTSVEAVGTGRDKLVVSVEPARAQERQRVGKKNPRAHARRGRWRFL